MARFLRISTLFGIIFSATAFAAIMLNYLMIPAFPDLGCENAFIPEDKSLILENADRATAHYQQYNPFVRFLTEHDQSSNVEEWGQIVGYRSLANIVACCETISEGRLYGTTQTKYHGYNYEMIGLVPSQGMARRNPNEENPQAAKLRILETNELVYVNPDHLEDDFSHFKNPPYYTFKNFRSSEHMKLYHSPDGTFSVAGPTMNFCDDLSYHDELTKNILLYSCLIFLLCLLGALMFRLDYPKIAAALMLAPLLSVRLFTENVFGRSIPNDGMFWLATPLFILTGLYIYNAIRASGSSPKHTGVKLLVVGIILLVGSFVIIGLLAAESFTEGYIYSIPASLIVLAGRLIFKGIREIANKKHGEGPPKDSNKHFKG